MGNEPHQRFLGTSYYFMLLVFCLAFLGFKLRLSMLSNCSINAMLPSGRPVLSCLCISRCSSDVIFSERKSDQSSLTLDISAFLRKSEMSRVV